MAETHELRIKIDAAAAQRGSREFVAAVTAIKNAVKGLERDTDGTFKKLKKSFEQVKSTGKLKIGIDATSAKTVDSFARRMQAAASATSAVRQQANYLRAAVDKLSNSFDRAQTTSEIYNNSLARGNDELRERIELAKRARTEMGKAPRTSARPATGGTGAGAGGTNEDGERLVSINRAIRAIDNQRAATVSLQAQLAKLGATGEVAALEKAFKKFENTVVASELSVGSFDDAITELNGEQKRSKVALTRFNAQIQAQRKELGEAADAAKEQTLAFREMAKAAKEAASAQSHQAQETARVEALSLRMSKAVRTASLSSQQLGERMKNIGMTDGFARLEGAFARFQSRLQGGVKTANELRSAQDALEKEMHDITLAVVAQEGAQRRAETTARRFAAAERSVASEASKVEREMRSLAGATNATSAAWHRATGNMRGMENAFNATYQAGTVFRNLLGGLTFGTFIRSVYQAGASLEQFMVTMEVATGSMDKATEANSFVDALAGKFGTNLRTAREDFAKFAVSTDLAGVSMEKTKDIFESVSMAMSVMGRGAEDQRLAFLALEQMMSKGTVSSEELRRQLGERLPGSVNLMAKALKVSTAELQKMLKLGSIDSATALPAFAEEVRKAFGPGLEKSTTRASRNIGTFVNEVEHFLTKIANSGFMDVLSVEFAELTKTMRTDEVGELAKNIGKNLSDMASTASNAMQFLVENAEGVQRALVALGVGFVAAKTIHFANFFASAAQQTAAFALQLRGSKAASDASTIATNVYTQSLAANTAGIHANAAAHASLLTSMNAANAARAGAGGGVAGAGVKDLGNNAQKVGGKLGALTGGLALATRGLTVFAPVVGIAATALLMMPGIMDAFTGAVVQGDRDLRTALRRSGVAFEDLGDTITGVASETAFDRLLTDLDALNSRLDTLNRQYSGETLTMDFVIRESKETGQDNPFEWRQNAYSDLFKGSNKSAVDEMLESQTSQTRALSADLAQAFKEVQAGTGDAIALSERVHAAFKTAPSGRTFFDYLLQSLQVYADAEQALIADRDRMASLKGADIDRDLVSLSKSGRTYLKDGEREDLEAFRREAEALKETYKEFPQALQKIQRMEELLTTARAEGQSVAAFATKSQDIYDERIQKIEDLQAKIRELSAETVKAEQTFAEMATAALANLDLVNRPASTLPILDRSGRRTAQLEDVPTGVITGLEELINEVNLGGKGAVDELVSYINKTDWGSEETKALVVQLATAATSVRDLSKEGDVLAASLTEAANGASDLLTPAIDIGEAFRKAAAYADAVNDAVKESISDGKALARDMDRQRQLLAMPKDQHAAQEWYWEALDNIDKLKAQLAGLSATGDPEERLAHAEATRALQEALAQLGPEYANIVRQAGLLAAAEARLDKIEERAKAYNSLRDSITDYAKGAREAHIALQLLATGQAKSQSSADLLATALMSGEAALVAEARAAISTADAYEARNKAIQSGLDFADGIKDHAKDLEKQSIALGLLVSGYIKGAENADLLAEAIASGSSVRVAETQEYLRQAQALQEVNKHRQQIIDVREDADGHVKSLQQQVTALKLLADGTVKSAEAADILANAMMTGDQALISSTQSTLAQAQALDTIREKMERAAEDPVKKWIEAVPQWAEGVREIQTGALASLSDSISELITTGEFNLSEFFGNIGKQFADMASQQIVVGISKATGFDEANKPNAVLTAADQSALKMGNALSQGGTTASTHIANSITTSASTAASAFSNGIVQGGNIAASSIKTAITSSLANLQQLSGMISATPGDLSFGSGVPSMPAQTSANLTFGKSADASALANGIVETANSLGMSPSDLATIISYETAGTFSPTKKGPRTQHGQHRGLIQFGEPQAQQHGVDWNDPLNSQLGADGAIAKYFRASGWKPGMSGLDAYSTVNAGRPGRYSASDANNGGAPGTVADKWFNQMGGHRDKADALLAGNVTGAGVGTEITTALDTGGKNLGQTLTQSLGQTTQQLGTTFQQGASQQQMAGAQTANQIRVSTMQAGGQHARGVQTAIQTAGAQHAAQLSVAMAQASAAQAATGITGALSSAISTAGAGAGATGAMATAASGMGGFWGPLGQQALMGGIGIVAGMFSEGGNASRPVASTTMPASAFASAPHYSEGTANTSGIPAVLHDNEAVVPLSRGRKIPVDLSGAGGGGSSVTFGDLHINVEGGSTGDQQQDNEFAQMMGESIRAQLEQMVERKLMEAQRYGGMANPRGGR